MKKIICFILIFLSFSLRISALELDISSESAILYNLDSGEVLYEKNADEVRSIASLTKIMTALVALENIDDLDETITLTSADFSGLAAANAVTAGFTSGEVVTYRDLLYGLLLPSGADAANALARNIAGSAENYIALMNEKVEDLGLENTHFSTVIGLDDEDNYSTAEEVAIIFKEALNNEDFEEIITTSTYTTSDNKLTFTSTIQSNATKFEIDIPYVLGGKTGTTTNAGLCLATIASENGTNYMLVTLGALYDKVSPHHLLDAKLIYDYFIQNYGNQVIVSQSDSFMKIKAKYTTQEEIELYPTDDVIKYLPNDYDEESVKLVYDGLEEVSAFDETGSVLGTLEIYYDDELIATQTITLNENLSFSLTSFIKEEIVIIAGVILVVVFIILFRKIKKRL